MNVTLNLFYFLSFVAIIAALMVVFSRNAVYSVLYLIITFFAIAGHYVLLNAQFLAAVHVIVYAGAIMVLFLYVIMLLDLNEAVERPKSNLLKFAAALSAGSLMIILIGALRGTETIQAPLTVSEDVGLVRNLGTVLFRDYLLPFEITSILLLTAMVGAVMLGKPEKTQQKKAS
jgi:NADH-quinone oxidoreductase subunit J